MSLNTQDLRSLNKILKKIISAPPPKYIYIIYIYINKKQTYRLTNQQPETRSHREVTLPIMWVVVCMSVLALSLKCSRD